MEYRSQINKIEESIGLPIGSTVLLTGTVNHLVEEQRKVDALTKLSPYDIVRNDISIETLESDKIRIRKEAWFIYELGLKILKKYETDLDKYIDTNDKMYTAGAGLVSSVMHALDKINTFIMKLEQDARMKQIMQPEVEAEEKKKINEYTPEQMMDLIRKVRSGKAQEAVVVSDSVEVVKTEEKTDIKQ